jgi:hypothetical protein
MTNKFKTYLLIGISIAAFVTMLCIPPIKQDPAFHNFADGREIASIKNFMNVLSNLPFMLIGTAGLWMIRKCRPVHAFEGSRTSSIVFLVGIFFTGIGSAFYHYDPNDSTLVWDRLPMTISFMSLFSILCSVFIGKDFGKKIFWPLIGFGLISILYWVVTGDLRLYAIVQFLPMLLIPLIMILYKNNHDLKIYFWVMIISYGIAKLFEAEDPEVYSVLSFISGHSIKHLFAALVPAVFLLCQFRKEKTTRSL